MQNKKTKELTLLAILTALSVTFGFVAKIPTPTGLLTLVDVYQFVNPWCTRLFCWI